MNGKNKVNDFDNELDSFLNKLNIGLLTASFTAIMTILQRESVDKELTIALYSLAVAFPMTIIMGVAPKLFFELIPQEALSLYKSKFEKKLREIITYVILALEIYAFEQIFSHFSLTLAFVFAITVLICAALFVILTLIKIKGINKEIKIIEEQKHEEMKKEIQKYFDEEIKRLTLESEAKEKPNNKKEKTTH